VAAEDPEAAEFTQRQYRYSGLATADDIYRNGNQRYFLSELLAWWEFTPLAPRRQVVAAIDQRTIRTRGWPPLCAGHLYRDLAGRPGAPAGPPR